MKNTFEIINNDSLIALKVFPDNHFDSVVTDPPYGISFMNRKWDYQIPSVELWKEVLRVLKPGGHILVACGTRTQHRMAVNIEDAGFEIRDIITWHYGSGFPKSMDVSKAIDKQNGVERDITKEGQTKSSKYSGKFDQAGSSERERRDNPVTDEAKRWNGWGTALKPATEFWTLARKPLIERTVAQNVMKHGTGGINIDSCRIATDDVISNHSRSSESAVSKGKYGDSSEQETHQTEGQKLGRFPANVLFDDVTGKMLDEQSGHLKSGNVKPEGFKGEYSADIYGKYGEARIDPNTVYADEGGASRFFYCAKASRAERNKGTSDGNKHPTIKPIKLMQYLIRLITPPNGIVLDPFNGSGTTGIACKIEGFNYVGIEMEKEYCDLSRERISAWDVSKTPDEQLKLFDF